MLQETDAHPPIRLTMLPIGLCKICGKNSECKFLTIEHLLGWYYCDNCKHTVKNSAITFIGDQIPVRNLLTRPIKFKRSSGESWIGVTNPLAPCLVFSQGKYMLELLFASTPEIENIDMIYRRFVPFKSILELNPEIYDEIINCTDFFCQDIKIGFNDLPHDVQHLLSI